MKSKTAGSRRPGSSWGRAPWTQSLDVARGNPGCAPLPGLHQLPRSGRPDADHVRLGQGSRIRQSGIAMLTRISHIALVVSDPIRTATLFENLFAARVVQRNDADGHDETFVRLGETWFVLGKASAERKRSRDHIAFHAPREKPYCPRCPFRLPSPRPLQTPSPL